MPLFRKVLPPQPYRPRNLSEALIQIKALHLDLDDVHERFCRLRDLLKQMRRGFRPELPIRHLDDPGSLCVEAMTSPSGPLTGSCVSCLQGTDTGLTVIGEPEFIVYALELLGVPPEQGRALFCAWCGTEPDLVPDCVMTVVLRVCAACASRSQVELPEPQLLLPGQRPHGIEQDGV